MPQLSETRPRVLELDEHTCQVCGTTKEIEIHHIVPPSLGGSHEVRNLITACHSCNKHLAAEQFRVNLGTNASSRTAIYNLAVLREFRTRKWGVHANPRDSYFRRRLKPKNDPSPAGRWVGLQYDKCLNEEGFELKYVWTKDCHIVFRALGEFPAEEALD